MAIYDLYDLRRYFQGIASGDENSLGVVFNLFKKRVYSVALKMLKSEVEAEEIIQEVFLSLWRSRSSLGLVENPENYIFTITYNIIYAHLKNIARNRELINGIILQFTEVQNTTEETIAVNETSKLIHDAYQKLPLQQRMVYDLNKKKNLSYEEIATELGLSKNTVRNHLAEARKSIRRFLKNHLSVFFL